MDSDRGLAELPDVSHVGFDPAELREKYQRERRRRLRPEGVDQYIEVAGTFAHMADDPYADASFARDPVSRKVDVVIVGGGFGGLLAAAQLRAAGFDDLYVVEKASDFGGAWYWNRFPGVACDTESYIYMPLLEETGYMPAAKYALGHDIREHARRIGRHYDLYRSALFQTAVVEMRWQADTSRWQVRTDRGDDLQARFVVISGGPLDKPKLPGIAGLDRFKGRMFHTARWDYDCTGGDSRGNLTKLYDKRVGIVGTGATAIQCVPHLAAGSKELYVFQRTPPPVDVRNNRPTDPEWVKGLKPGWQRERMDNFTAVISGEDFDVDLVNDGWTDIIGNILLVARRQAARGEKVADEAALIQLADYQKMERVRARVDAVMQDPATAEVLKPWYNQFCKRPCFHDEFLASFNLPNVHLVDTEGRGVEQVTERGVLVNGREYELDCLVLSTGFEWGTDYTRRVGFEIYGRDGLPLTEKWKDGVRSLHGMFTIGFPNLLFMMLTHSGQSANFMHLLDAQSRHVAHVLRELRERSVTAVEPTAESEASWTQTIVDLASKREGFLKECTPSYNNNEGKLDERTARNSRYWDGLTVFLRLLDAWRKEGNLQGLELTRGGPE